MRGPAGHRGGTEGGVDRPGARTPVRRSSPRTGRPVPRPSSPPADAPARRLHRGSRRALPPASGGNPAAEMSGCRADRRDGSHERFVPNHSHQPQSLSLPNGKVARSHRIDDEEFWSRHQLRELCDAEAALLAWKHRLPTSASRSPSMARRLQRSFVTGKRRGDRGALDALLAKRASTPVHPRWGRGASGAGDFRGQILITQHNIRGPSKAGRWKGVTGGRRSFWQRHAFTTPEDGEAALAEWEHQYDYEPFVSPATADTGNGSRPSMRARRTPLRSRQPGSSAKVSRFFQDRLCQAHKTPHAMHSKPV